MTAHLSLAAKPQTRVYEVMLAQWITSTARAAAGKAQHTATRVRGVVGRRLALQRYLEASAVMLQTSAILAQAVALDGRRAQKRWACGFVTSARRLRPRSRRWQRALRQPGHTMVHNESVKQKRQIQPRKSLVRLCEQPGGPGGRGGLGVAETGRTGQMTLLEL